MSTTANARPLVFGEVLFDLFPDGVAVLGGAPFNVAWHLQGFGLQPLFISRVGDDDTGREVLERMREWGMETSGVQVDPMHPTGAVRITLAHGQPSFDIVAEQAYDYIDQEQALKAVGDGPVAALYSGTLATRNPVSGRALAALAAATRAPRFVDINLRAPWWDHRNVDQALQGAQWAKLNDKELLQVARQDSADLSTLGAALRQKYDLALLIVTLGEKGALFVTPEGTSSGAPVPVTNPVDTVGAGDAFSAVVLLGLMHGWPLPVIRQRALQFASDVCTLRGATTHDRAFYAGHVEQWQGPVDRQTDNKTL